MDVEQRARFEEWINKVYPDRDLERWPDGKYAYSFAALAWEVWQAALTPPEGYVLVPVEPTMGMLREAAKHDYYSSKDPTWRDLYQVMLAARPEVKP